MRRIDDEAALGLDRLFERGQHRVERAAEPRQLVAPAPLGHPLARVSRLGDALGSSGEPPNRRKRRARDERTGCGRDRDTSEGHEHEDQLQPVELVVDALKRTCDDHGAGAVQKGRDDLPRMDSPDRRVADEVIRVSTRCDGTRRRVDRQDLRRSGIRRNRRAVAVEELHPVP